MRLKLLTIVGLVFFAVSTFAQGMAGAGSKQEASAQPTEQASQTPTAPAVSAATAKQCLIVTSAEGHRFQELNDCRCIDWWNRLRSRRSL